MSGVAPGTAHAERLLTFNLIEYLRSFVHLFSTPERSLASSYGQPQEVLVASLSRGGYYGFKCRHEQACYCIRRLDIMQSGFKSIPAYTH